MPFQDLGFSRITSRSGFSRSGFRFERNIGVSDGLRVQSRLAYWYDLGQIIYPGSWFPHFKWAVLLSG